MANKLGGPQNNEQKNVIFHPPLCIDEVLLLAPAAHSAPNKMKMSPPSPEATMPTCQSHPRANALPVLQP